MPGDYDEAAAGVRAGDRDVAGQRASSIASWRPSSARQGNRHAALGAPARRPSALDPSDARACVQLGEVLEEQGRLRRRGRRLRQGAGDRAGRRNRGEAGHGRAGADLARLPDGVPGHPGSAAQVDARRPGRAHRRAAARRCCRRRRARRPWSSPTSGPTGRRPWIMAVVRAGVMEPYPEPHLRAARRSCDASTWRRWRVAGAAADGRAGRRSRASGRPPGRGSPICRDPPGVSCRCGGGGAGVMPLADGTASGRRRAVSGAEALDVVDRLEGLTR